MTSIDKLSMVVYKFLYNGPKGHEFKKPVLYAFTNKKGYADEFKRYRDMKRFEIITEKMSKKEYEMYRDDLRYRELQLFNAKTRSNDYKAIDVEIVVTYDEAYFLKEKCAKIWDGYEYLLCDPVIMKGNYRNALDKLLMLNFYGCIRLKHDELLSEYLSHPEYSAFGPPSGLIIEEFMQSYTFDQLAVFVKYFGHTL